MARFETTRMYEVDVDLTDDEMEGRLARLDAALVPWSLPVPVGSPAERTFGLLLIIEAEDAAAADRTWQDRGETALRDAGFGPDVAHLTSESGYTGVRPVT